MDPSQKKPMPDIASSQVSPVESPLDWVGMEKIDLPLQVDGGQQIAAQVNLFVNIMDPKAKGIHMSRLYLVAKENLQSKELNLKLLRDTLASLIDSQEGLSDSASICLKWKQLFERKALISDNSGWKSYPIELYAQNLGGKIEFNLKFSFFYSSTCPCSAALSRQLFQRAFSKEFCEDNLTFEKAFQWLGENQIASPHSQRSRADVSIKLNSDQIDLNIIQYINILEAAVQTPVQTAVKREDEQEFAKLNGENLMFVEDALRRMKQSLSQNSQILNFEIKTHHFESLHSHDAVGVIKNN